MKTARNLDIAIVISGDGDFAPAIRAVQEMGVRVEVVSFRGNTSSDLIEVADLFTDITQLARVDKTSSRSGRRVAGDEEDLSMTEVPDKQTEGTGQRGRGRGRGRGRPGEAEPVAARSRTGGRTSTARTAAAGEPVAATAAAGNGALVVLPGEKLSRVAPAAALPAAAPVEGLGDEELPFDVDPESMPGGADADADLDGEGEAGRRRRRRRGGRGRGRGRGRDGEALPAGEATEGGEAPAPASESFDDDEEDEPEAAPAPRGPRTTPFGSVWDSQIGTPTSRPANLGPVVDDEDFDEPEIPEYLIAEQRRGRPGQGQGGAGGRGGQGRGGPRGGRSAYSSAIDRERYGRGGGGGINRYPDVSGRTGQAGQSGRSGGGRQEGGYARQDASYSRGPAPERFDRPAPKSGDPWSEVPPELEEMLRAQLAQSPKARRPERAPAASRIEAADAAGEIETMTETPIEAPAAPKRRTSTRKKADGEVGATVASIAETEAPAAPKRRTATRRTAATAETPAAAVETAAEAEAPATPKRRTATRKSAASADSPAATVEESADGGASVPAAPKRRTTTRKKAESA
jgi:NYN domain